MRTFTLSVLMHTLGASAAVHKLAVRQQGPLLPSGGWANGTFSGIEIATTSKIASSGFSSGEIPLPTVIAAPNIVIPMGTGNLPAPSPTTSFEAQLPPYFPDGPPFPPTRPTAETSVASSSAASVAEDVASISSAVQSAASAAEEDVSTFDSVFSAGESATSASVSSTIPSSSASATESNVVLVTVVPILQSAGYAEAVSVAAGDSITTIIRTTYITVINNAIVTTSDAMIVIVPATATATPTFEMTTTVVPLGPNSVTLTVLVSTTVTVDEDVSSTTTSWTTVTQSVAGQTTTLNNGTATVTPTVFVTRTTGTAGYPTGTAISYLAIQTGTGPAFNFTVLAAPYTNNTNPNAATEIKARTALLAAVTQTSSALHVQSPATLVLSLFLAMVFVL